jgi:multicomponent Na+:H+ antiporter subunit D
VGGYGWLIAVYVCVSAATGGAVLRVAGRVFVGWGSAQGPPSHQQLAADEEDEMRDERDHTPVVMVLVPAVLLVGAIVAGLIPGAVPGVERYAAQFVTHHNYAAWVLHGAAVPVPDLPPSHVSADDYGYGAMAIAGALLVASLGLFGQHALGRTTERLRAPVRGAVGSVRALHSGHIGDYIAWWSAGASLIGGVCLLALR